MSDIFVKVKNSVSKQTAIVGKKSQSFIEVTKLNTLITTLETKKQRLITELGSHHYSHFKKRGLGTEQSNKMLATICDAIAEVDQEIVEKTQEIERIKEEERKLQDELSSSSSLTCVCGTQIRSDALFCGNCGQKVSDLKVELFNSDDKEMCQNCGGGNKMGFKFCSHCGTKKETDCNA